MNPTQKKEIEQFKALIAHLWRGGEYGYLWTKSGDEKLTQWFQPHEPLPPFSDKEDVYFGVMPVGSGKKRRPDNRAIEKDIVAINCLYADFDSKDMPKEQVLEKVRALEPKPSVIIDSGGGYHVYHLLTQPVLINPAKLANYKHALEGWVLMVGGDKNAHDLPRVLRVPGSFNQKYDGRMVHFIECDLTRTYDGLELLNKGLTHYENIQASLAAANPKPSVALAMRATVNKDAVNAYVDTILKDVDLLAITGSGNRTNTLFKTACRIGNIVGAGLLTYGDAEGLLFNASLSNGLVRDKGEKYVRTQICNGLDKGQVEPLDLTRFEEYHNTQTGLSIRNEPIETPSPDIAPTDTKPVYSATPAEIALLGLILTTPNLFLDIRDKLGVRAEMFYNSRHQVIWSAMDFCSVKGLPDKISVEERLKMSGWLSNVGGSLYLEELKESDHHTEALPNYVETIKDTAIRRGLKVAGRAIDALSSQTDRDGQAALNLANSALRSITTGTKTQDESSLNDGASELYLQLAASLSGVQYGSGTGFKALDRCTRLLPGKGIIIMARPGMGKTAFMLNMAWQQAKAGKRVGFVSLEMGREEVNARLASIDKGIPYKHILYRDLKSPLELKLYQDYMRELPKTFFLNDSKGQTMPQILAWARHMASTQGLDHLYIDYIGRVHFAEGSADTRRIQFGDATLQLLDFASEFQVTALLASQVNRDCEKRSDKRPLESDIAESDQIAHHADQIWAVYRDHVYNPDSSPNSMQILIRKSRQGEIAPVNLACDLTIQRITDCAWEYDNE